MSLVTLLCTVSLDSFDSCKQRSGRYEQVPILVLVHSMGCGTTAYADTQIASCVPPNVAVASVARYCQGVFRAAKKWPRKKCASGTDFLASYNGFRVSILRGRARRKDSGQNKTPFLDSDVLVQGIMIPLTVL